MTPWLPPTVWGAEERKKGEKITTRKAGVRGQEGVPGLPGAPQDEAGLTRKFDHKRRGHHNENPVTETTEQHPFPTTREKPIHSNESRAQQNNISK